MLQPIGAGRDDTVVASVQASPPVRWVLASLSLSVLLSSLGTSIANVALPTLAQAFDASFQEVQWIVLAYLLAITTLIVSVGRLGDITGRRRLLLSGILVFTVASMLCGIAPTLPLLVAARAMQGIGAAAMMALTMAFVGATVPKAKTGSAIRLDNRVCASLSDRKGCPISTRRRPVESLDTIAKGKPCYEKR